MGLRVFQKTNLLVPLDAQILYHVLDILAVANV